MGLATGLVSGLMGVGGGVLMVPAMVLVLGYTQHKAHGTSLAVMVFLASVSAASYAFHGSVAWWVAVTLVPGGIIGASIGARLASRIRGRHLRRIFAVFILLTGIRMIWGALGSPGPEAGGAGLHGASAAIAGLVTGLASGCLAGLLGVGGGIIMVPVMSLALGMSQQLSQGTSLVAIIPTAISGALTHNRLGNVDTTCAVWMAAGAAVGGVTGSAAANSISSQTLMAAFGIFLVLMSVVTGLQKPHPPAAVKSDTTATTT